MPLSTSHYVVPLSPAAPPALSPSVITSTKRLLEYCRANDWAGHDPYDALNSRFFEVFPILNRKLPRLAATQLQKRSPINLRRLLLIPPTHNPKAIALFLSCGLPLSKLGLVSEGEVARFLELLVSLRSEDSKNWCWGYSFPWQGRAVLVRRGAPNLVCTIFVANAFLDAFEVLEEQRYLEIGLSAARYVADELYWSEKGKAGFSYPMPGVRSEVHNANLLAAALLCRVSSLSGDSSFVDKALLVARQSVEKQRDDGSWYYGELPTQDWIDNFHTGYNLSALDTIGRSLRTSEFEESRRRGFSFYFNHFFRKDGAPRYFHNQTYPIDAHCVAQSIITLLASREFQPDTVERAIAVYQWTMANLWDERGYFYYQKTPLFTNRISYMRWTQAWMLSALTALLEFRS